MAIELGRGLIGERLAESFLLVEAQADPPAGADFAITVPGRATWELIALRAVLVVDATVATRAVHLMLDDGTRVYCEVPQSRTQIASETWTYTWARDLGYAANDTTAFAQLLGIPSIALPPGHRIRASTANLQAADNWAAPVLLVREVPERGELGELAAELRVLHHQLAALAGAGGLEGL